MEDKKYTRSELTKLNKELKPQGEKCCSKCEEVKPLDEFHIRGKLKNGDTRYGHCKKCKNSTETKYYNP